MRFSLLGWIGKEWVFLDYLFTAGIYKKRPEAAIRRMTEER